MVLAWHTGGSEGGQTVRRRGGPDEWRGGKLKLRGGRASFAWPFPSKQSWVFPAIRSWHSCQTARPKADTENRSHPVDGPNDRCCPWCEGSCPDSSRRRAP